MLIILLGPPGAGKGTQAQRLRNLGFEHISTGDLIRREIQNGSKIGLEIKEIVNSGGFASDSIFIDLLREEIGNIDKRKIILDGFPRTLVQAQAMKSIFSEEKNHLLISILIDCGKEAASRRISKRAICKKCGTVQSLKGINLDDEKCINCYSENLIKREDDSEHLALLRYKTYMESTMPVIEYYENLGILHRLNGNLDAESVQKNIEIVLRKFSVL